MPGILKRTYTIEQDSDVKAHIVRVSAGLMSEASEEILQDALQSDDETVKSTADKIMEDRERAGKVVTYDENAHKGMAMKKAVFGR